MNQRWTIEYEDAGGYRKMWIEAPNIYCHADWMKDGKLDVSGIMITLDGPITRIYIDHKDYQAS